MEIQISHIPTKEQKISITVLGILGAEERNLYFGIPIRLRLARKFCQNHNC